MSQYSEESSASMEVALMGGWLMVSPLMLGFVTTAAAAVPTVVAGALIGLFGFRHALRPYKEDVFSWVNALLGLEVLLSPWIFGFQNIGLAVVNNVLIGLGVIFFASRSLRHPPWPRLET